MGCTNSQQHAQTPIAVVENPNFLQTTQKGVSVELTKPNSPAHGLSNSPQRYQQHSPRVQLTVHGGAAPTNLITTFEHNNTNAQNNLNTGRGSMIGQHQQQADMMFYDENIFMEQAIHQSLKDNAQIADDDLEFNRALQQVLQESKVDYEIDKRKKREEETMLISQIPELREAKIKQIISEAGGQRGNKLQPINAPVKVQMKSNNSLEDTWGANAMKSPEILDSKSMKMKLLLDDPKSSSLNQSPWQVDTNATSQRNDNNYGPITSVKTINYQDVKKANPYGESIHRSSDWNKNEGNSLVTRHEDSSSKPSLQLTTAQGNDYQNEFDNNNNDIDLDELKAFLDEGVKQKRSPHRTQKLNDSYQKSKMKNTNFDEEAFDDFL